MMKFNKKLKKGFTLVELVVVIAVIAVLAAVSVGAYFGVTETANRSAAFQHVKQMNDMLTMSKILDGENNNTFHEARRDVQKQGLDPVTLKEFGTYKYGWIPSSDKNKIDQFVIVNSIKNEEDKYEIVAPFEDTIEDPSNIFVIAKTSEDLLGDFSYYLHDNFITNSSTLIVKSGLDTGLFQNIEEIRIENSIESKLRESNNQNSDEETSKIIVNTNFYDVRIVINEKLDREIHHYGSSFEVKLTDTGIGGYKEHGISSIIAIEKGNISFENGSETFVLRTDSGNPNESNVSKIENNGAKTFPIIDPTNFDCSAGHDSNKARIIPDLINVYNICSVCGLTLNSSSSELTDVNPEPIGWLPTYLDTTNYKSSCDHSHDRIERARTDDIHTDGKKITSETCLDCYFFFLSTSCAHNYVSQNFVNAEGLAEAKCTICGDSAFTPQANVTEVLEADKNAVLGAFGGSIGLFNIPEDYNPGGNISNALSTLYGTYDGEVADYSCGYEFRAVDTPEILDKPEFKYQNWLADFVVKFDAPVQSKEIGLWGFYENFGVAVSFTMSKSLEANEPIPLMTTIFGTPWPYQSVVQEVQVFRCGAINFSDNHAPIYDENGTIVKSGTKITVELDIINPVVFEMEEYKQYLNDPVGLLTNEKLRKEKDLFLTIGIFPDFMGEAIDILPKKDGGPNLWIPS